MASRPISALLAMPAALRPLLWAQYLASSQMRSFHETCASSARYLRRPVSIGAFTVPHSPALPLSEIPISELLDSPTPNKTLDDELRTLFIKNPATFYHGTSDFYELKKNTRVPEICILGRSNVGKSTFVNALANRRENELAHTSARAGRTKAMNAFGFGPAPLMRDLADTDTKTKRTEDLPKHTFFVLDMPGYGHKSLKEWGKHISLYLKKRQSIKGAILLIDGEVGPKNGDIMALELLQEAGVKTAIVLTKADKAKHEDLLKETCKGLWNTMRDINSRDPNSKWEWEKDFFVTALGATKKEIGADTVAVARLAVARLAGLVKEKDRTETESSKGWSGKTVSFDDLVFAKSITPIVETTSQPQLTKPPQSPISPSISSFTALERAAMEQHRARTGAGRLSASGWGSPQQVRASHTLPPGGSRPTTRELEAILKDFVTNLKAKSAPPNRAEMSQDQSHRARSSRIWDPTFRPPPKNEIKKREEAKARHRGIYQARLSQEVRRAERQAFRDRLGEIEKRDKGRQTRERVDREDEDILNNDDGQWARSKGGDVVSREDLLQAWNEADEQTGRQLHGKKVKKSKETDKRKKKGKGPADSDELDPFVAKFANVR